MKIAHLLIFWCVITSVLDRQSNSPKIPPPIGFGSIHPTMILWNTGLVETITPATLGNRKTWCITHYPQDPADSKINDYDLYDLDQTTFAPLRSMINNEESHLELIFSEKEVTLAKLQARTLKRSEFRCPVQYSQKGLGLIFS